MAKLNRNDDNPEVEKSLSKSLATADSWIRYPATTWKSRDKDTIQEGEGEESQRSSATREHIWNNSINNNKPFTPKSKSKDSSVLKSPERENLNEISW